MIEARLGGQSLRPTADVCEPYGRAYEVLVGTGETLRAWRVPVELLCDGPNEIEIASSAAEDVRIACVDLAAA